MKKQRQNKIIEIIEKYEVTTQEALKKHLEDEGITVTQATLSRDINELNLKKKVSSTGANIYVCVKKKTVQCPAIFKDAVIDIVYAMNTVVIKCHTGMAQAACATLDKMEDTGIVGTIAGDDTVLVVVKSEKDAASLTKTLTSMIDN